MKKVLANTTDGGTPVHIGPIMQHFTKDEKNWQVWTRKLINEFKSKKYPFHKGWFRIGNFHWLENYDSMFT